MEEKVAIITGAATGIGRSIALCFAKHGINIVLNYNSSYKQALETKREIEELGVECLIHQSSVTNLNDIERLMKDTKDRFNRIDILVNNAGATDFIEHHRLDDIQDEQWQKVIDTNVKSVFNCSRAALPELRKTNGCIINISSVAGQTGLGSSIAYAASKAAVNSLTKSLARVCAPEVRVNSIAPGVIETRWTVHQQDFIENLTDGVPLQRVGKPEDVAEFVYALTAYAGYVTGEIIRVDGGMFIG